MAETVAPQLRHEDLAPRAVEGPAESLAQGSRLVPPLPRPLAILWLAIVGGLAIFLVFGSLRVGAGNWFGRQLAVREIWTRFLGYLRDQGASTVVVVAVSVLAGLTVVLAAYCLWLALALRDASPSETADGDPAEMA